MWWQWAERINHACQIRVGSGSVRHCQSPEKSSFLWSSSQVSGYLSGMAAVDCSSLLLLGTAGRFVEALAGGLWVWLWMLAMSGWHYSAESTAFLSGETWKSVLVSSKGGEVFIGVGTVGTTFWDNCWLLFRYQKGSLNNILLPILQTRWGLSRVISYHRDYTCNAQENINKGRLEHHSPKEEQKFLMRVGRRKSTPSSVNRVRKFFVGITK